MADAGSTKRNYPYVSASVWAELKSRFQRSLPAKVTPTYLQSALGFASEKAAKNLIPQLKLLGLIDGDGTPTDLAKRFRLDTEYATATAEMLAATYPDELRSLYPGPDDDVADVTNWLMIDTGGGQASATIQARFYLLLASGKLPQSDKPAKAAKPATPKPAPAKKPTAKASAPAAAEAQQVDHASGQPVHPPAAPALAPPGGSLPGMHIDIQIHIDSSASADQIDAVFSSMAKHLYGRQ